MSETEPAARWEIAPHNGIVSADPPFTDKLFASRMAVVARETATEYWEFAVVKEHAQLLADYLNDLEARAALAEAALRKIDTDNRVVSGSIGPLMDVGFSMGWKMARDIAHDALTQGAGEVGR